MILELFELLFFEFVERIFINLSFYIILFSVDNTRKSKGDNKEDINIEEKMEKLRTILSEEFIKQFLKFKNYVI